MYIYIYRYVYNLLLLFFYYIYVYFIRCLNIDFGRSFVLFYKVNTNQTGKNIPIRKKHSIFVERFFSFFSF